MRTRSANALAIAFVLTCAACAPNGEAEVNMAGSMPTLADVSPEQWAALAGRRVFFGHQSVGGNIMEGVQEILRENPQIPLTVVETADPDRMDRPALYHARIGENGVPSSKLTAFNDVVSASAVAESGIALVKFCYVDIDSDTDPEALFESYRDGVSALRAAHPGLTIVHVTLPLRADPGFLAYWKARLRGRVSDWRVNLIRQRYNELLRRTYAGREPVFDLARLESSTADGTSVTVRHHGEQVPVLAPEWTYDGGHLNEAGRRRIAEVFLATLATL